jgi:predicted NUDIX family NTP pyrophosphohydrolase
MQKRSAGILAYRYHQQRLEVLLVHPGGPFFKNKDAGAWSIPKGEYEEGEDPLEAAKREFEEETGNVITAQDFIMLDAVKIKSGKIIVAWAVENDFEKAFVRSNFFEMEWPPKSGKKQQFAEVDKAEWFASDIAKEKINAGQIRLLEQLITILNRKYE